MEEPNETIEVSFEKKGPKKIQEDLDLIRVVDCGGFSAPVFDGIEKILNNQEVKANPQFSEEASDFIQENKDTLSGGDLKIIALHLITESSPTKQSKIIEDVDYLLKYSETEIENERQSLSESLRLEIVLNKAEEEGTVNLLDFFQNPDNQKGREDLLQKNISILESNLSTLEEVRPLTRLDVLGTFVAFFKNPENQKGREDLLQKINKIVDQTLIEIKNLADLNDDQWDYNKHYLLEFFKNPENQKGRENLVQKVIAASEESADWGYLLRFFQNPENQKGREDLVQKALEEEIKNAGNKEHEKQRFYFRWVDVMGFFQNPENQKGMAGFVDDLVKQAGEQEEWSLLLDFFQNPENQKGREDLVQKSLEGAESDEDGYIYLLRFFKEDKNQPLRTPLASIFIEKIKKAANSISDINLKGEFLQSATKYMDSEENPLSLISLEPRYELPVLLEGYLLNIDPIVVKSWHLSEENMETIMPILINLHRQGIKFEFPLPFVPKSEIKKTDDFTKRIIDYFRKIDFLSGLEDLGGDVLVEKHLAEIKKACDEYGIRPASLELPFAFLKNIIKEERSLSKELLDKFIKVVGIEGEVSFDEFLQFVNSWNGDIKPLITLASHYQKNYPEGQPLLGKIVNSLIKGEYLKLKYDLTDGLTKQQLEPILSHFPPEKSEDVIQDWRKEFSTFRIVEKDKELAQKEGSVNFDEIREYLKGQIVEHNHFKGLVDSISELGELPRESLDNIKNKITELLAYNLYPKEEKGRTLDIGKIKNELDQIGLDKEKQKIIIGLITLFQNIRVGNKSAQEILNTLGKIEFNIKTNWPEVENLDFSQDLFGYLKDLLEKSIRPQEKEKERKIYLSHFTDHPKTLLEIGKYPVSSCQSFESSGSYNTSLLGYVFDAHIKALVIREIELPKDIIVSEEDLNNAQINIDEGKNEIEIVFVDGRKIKNPISRPIARRMAFLGEKDNVPDLVLEPVYSLGNKELYEEIMNDSVKKLRGNFEDIGMEIVDKSGEKIKIAGSHNPNGHYNDLEKGQTGRDGKSYYV